MKQSSEAAVWEWDLATGRIHWHRGLAALFGYKATSTDAKWRESRIHPEDREEAQRSLQRATIENPGGVWSHSHRFRHADGRYAQVTERAYVVSDAAGPRRVVGTITAHLGRSVQRAPRRPVAASA